MNLIHLLLVPDRLDLFKVTDLSKARPNVVIVVRLESGTQSGGEVEAHLYEDSAMSPREEHQQEPNEEPVARSEGGDTRVSDRQQILEDVTQQVGDAHEAKDDQLGPGSAADKVASLMAKLEPLKTIVSKMDQLAEVM